MHEFSLMQSVREQALAHLQQHRRREVIAITLRIGDAAGVDADALALAFPCVMVGTPLAAAQLTLETVPGSQLQLAALELL